MQDPGSEQLNTPTSENTDNELQMTLRTKRGKTLHTEDYKRTPQTLNRLSVHTDPARLCVVTSPTFQTWGRKIKAVFCLFVFGGEVCDKNNFPLP